MSRLNRMLGLFKTDLSVGEPTGHDVKILEIVAAELDELESRVLSIRARTDAPELSKLAPSYSLPPPGVTLTGTGE